MAEKIALSLIISPVIAFILSLPFIAIDWTTGEHGRLTVTAVDKNLFGTHTVYVRNSESFSGNETLEVRYCIDADDVELTQEVKGAIGKQNVTLVYPEKRIGFIWFDKCRTAPIKEIKEN